MKNMKLTHLSLSVLIALGLVACGGSDNKDNMTIDKDKHGETGGKGGNGGGKPQITPEQTGTLPQRYTPSLNVPDDLKGQVASRKRFVVRRGFADPALGYDKDAKVYEKALNTEPADIKRTSIYNYVKEKDLVAVSADGTKATGGFGAKAKGAISIGYDSDVSKFNTADNKINAWVEGAGGKYYRVYPDSAFADYNSKTPFKVAKMGATEADLGGKDPTKIAQSDVVFIANADVDQVELKLGEAGKFILGQSTKQKEVVLNELSAFGGDYGVRALSQNLDLSQFPKDATKIQEEKIVGKYQVINTKGTADNGDDTVLDRKVVLGNARVYNLPYSIALVTTNAKMDDEKNIFNLDGTGAFQLNGFQTTSVPKDGRAIYKGKSFSATTEGDVDLFADFFENEAGISGRIHNRKDKVTKEDLAELTLELISLTTPNKHRTGSSDGDVNVKGDSSYANNWTVQLYGADAQEAGGFLRLVETGKPTEVKEVYTSQRQTLGNKSNDNTTK